jgi:hypothetical protein
VVRRLVPHSNDFHQVRGVSLPKNERSPFFDFFPGGVGCFFGYLKNTINIYDRHVGHNLPHNCCNVLFVFDAPGGGP